MRMHAQFDAFVQDFQLALEEKQVSKEDEQQVLDQLNLLKDHIVHGQIKRSHAIVHADQARYLEGLEPPRDPLLSAMEADAARRDLPMSYSEVALVPRGHRARANSSSSSARTSDGAIRLARAAGTGC